MAEVDARASLVLSMVSGIGTIGYAKLVRHFGTADAVLCAGADVLTAQTGLRPALAKAVASARGGSEADTQLDWADRNGARILPLEHSDYPASLKEIADPPPILYVKGTDLGPCQRAIGVVGSRRISPYGREVTKLFCRAFAEWGISVISGLALGVDGQAHRAALDGNGHTVAVLGTGLDKPYPPEHLDLCRDVAKTGAVVTEFAPGSKPLGAHFPRRNRIISGLSLGVVVVEAQQGSGSLITARLAADQGRGVFAVPGNIDQPGAKGTNALIRDGASLVTSPQEVVAELLPHLAATLTPKDEEKTGYDRDAAALLGLPEPAPKIFAFLGPTPISVDQLVEQLELETTVLLATLLQMEMAGIVEKMPGNRYILVPRCG
jgi:DNA processing protein